MERKERFITAMNCGQPDKVPFHDFLFSQPLFEEVLGRKVKTYNAVDAVECATKLGLDAIWIPTGGYAGYAPQFVGEDSYIDEWGTTYTTRSSSSWPIDAPTAYPVKNREDLRNWKAPEPGGKERTEPLREAIACNKEKLAIIGGVLGPFTAATMIMGLENLCVQIYDDPSLVEEFMKQATDFSAQMAARLFEAGADVLSISDDLGYSNDLFISPALMRKHVLPWVFQLVRDVKRHGDPVLLHCDGNINSILEDIAACGIDALHPIERKAHMDLKEVKRQYGKKICPFGNVDVSTTLAYGTTEEIEEAVKECLRIAAPGGGYVIGSDHSLSQGIPVRNALAFTEAIKKYRHYPITV